MTIQEIFTANALLDFKESQKAEAIKQIAAGF